LELHDLTLTQAKAKLAKKELSSVELTRAALARIAAVEPVVHAFVTVDAEGALKAAQEADERRARGESGPLLGLPLALKDNLSTKGLRTTCSSKMLEPYVPPFDASAVSALRKAGAVILGKTNLDEFAMGSSTENSAFGPTRNPWDSTRVPGGSSGGSAAAVAAGFGFGALGSDTGGSIRQPASLCGVVGLKPTYGRVSRYGLIAFASSLDQIGPLARTVEDAAALSQVIDGHDAMDTTSIPRPVPDYATALKAGVKGLKIGLPKEYFVDGMAAEVSAAVRAAVASLESLGAEVREVSLPHTEHCLSVYYLLATAEASSNLARFDGVRYGFRAQAASLVPQYTRTRAQGFGPEVKRRIMLGTYALSSGYYDAYYKRAQQVRTLIARDFEEAFKSVDMIATPTAPSTAFRLGEKADDPMTMYLSDIFTISVNLAGVPAISLPCGFDRGGLPIGLQLIGRAFDEGGLFAAAHAYEREHEWKDRRPNPA
jgi:aspartyl-tRNA(Asn)/glutamyl-tRNA(Gln) amidotransferase subunit A